jgi:hypothetical protein
MVIDHGVGLVQALCDARFANAGAEFTTSFHHHEVGHVVSTRSLPA